MSISPDVVFDGEGFTIRRIVTPPLDNNVYLIVCTETTESLIVDAAGDAEAIIAMADGTQPSAVVTTHGHWDHHGAIPAVTEALNIPFMVNVQDEEIAGKTSEAPLTEGKLRIGAIEAVILTTPGHTPGSVCIALNGVVLTGDTLFPGGPGATRSDHSSFDAIINSIKDSLFTMPDDTVVLPGHGDATTIGTERPNLSAWITRGW